MSILLDDMKKAPIRAFLFIILSIYIIFSIAKSFGLFAPGYPLKITQIDTEIVQTGPPGSEAVRFVVHGQKLTDQALVAMNLSWVFSDNTSMPVLVTREDGSAPPGLNGRVIQNGEYFVSASYSVPIPSAAASDPGVRLRWCWTYVSLPIQCEDRLLSDIRANPAAGIDHMPPVYTNSQAVGAEFD